MFLHVSVILSTGGVCPITCWDTHNPPPPGPEAGTPQTRGRHPPPGPEAGTPPPGADTRPGPEAGNPTVQCMLGDTGNKRAVRILLECNLVQFIASQMQFAQIS